MSVYSFTDGIIALTRLSYNLLLIGVTPGAIIGAALMGFSLSAVIAEDWNRIAYNGAAILNDLSKPFIRKRPARRYKQQTRAFQRRPVVQSQVQTISTPTQRQQSSRQSIQKNKHLRFVRKHALPVILLRRKKKMPTDDRKVLEMQKYRKSVTRDEIFFGRISGMQRF